MDEEQLPEPKRRKIEDTVINILRAADMDTATELSIRADAAVRLGFDLSSLPHKRLIRDTIESFLLSSATSAAQPKELLHNNSETNDQVRQVANGGAFDTADCMGRVICKLNSKRMVTVRSLGGKTLVSIWDSYRKDGKQVPSGRGVNLTVKQWSSFRSSFTAIEEAITKMESEIRHEHVRKKTKANKADTSRSFTVDAPKVSGKTETYIPSSNDCFNHQENDSEDRKQADNLDDTVKSKNTEGLISIQRNQKLLATSSPMPNSAPEERMQHNSLTRKKTKANKADTSRSFTVDAPEVSGKTETYTPSSNDCFNHQENDSEERKQADNLDDTVKSKNTEGLISIQRNQKLLATSSPMPNSAPEERMQHNSLTRFEHVRKKTMANKADTSRSFTVDAPEVSGKTETYTPSANDCFNHQENDSEERKQADNLDDTVKSKNTEALISIQRNQKLLATSSSMPNSAPEERMQHNSLTNFPSPGLVPITRFDGKNYYCWKHLMEFFLKQLNIAYVLTEPCPKVPMTPEVSIEETVQAKAAVKKWIHDDHVCCRSILNSLSDKLFEEYSNKTYTSKELWEKLKLLYDEDFGTMRSQVNKYIQFQILDGISILDQVLELNKIADSIMASGVWVDENFHVSAIISKLPPSWKDYRVKLMNEKFLLLNTLMHRLKTEENSHDHYRYRKPVGSSRDGSKHDHTFVPRN